MLRNQKMEEIYSKINAKFPGCEETMNLQTVSIFWVPEETKTCKLINLSVIKDQKLTSQMHALKKEKVEWVFGGEVRGSMVERF